MPSASVVALFFAICLMTPDVASASNDITRPEYEEAIFADALVKEQSNWKSSAIDITQETSIDVTESPYDTVVQETEFITVSNASAANSTTNATAPKKPAAKPKAAKAAKAAKETQIITQRFGGIDTSTFKGPLKKVYELGFCIALGVYDASAKTCSASVTSSVVAPAATGIVPETEFMEAATTGSVSMQATTNQPEAAQNAEGMTSAKFVAGAQTALKDTGATLPAGSAIASADSITVSKPTVTAKKEDSAAPAPAQVASLALVFGIVAATNSLFA
jgi:hypothetical protein